MASASVVVGGYIVPANQPATFTFWWPDGGNDQMFFDVAIQVKKLSDIQQSTMIPLEQIGRAMSYAPNVPGQVLYLTLRNDNPFDVPFNAVHLKVQ